MKKKNYGLKQIVYSTHPENIPQEEDLQQEALPAAQQKLWVALEKKGRGGKVVTLVANFEGPDAELEDLGKRLKVKCGTGGNVKDGEILIQGDCREKVTQFLKEWGYGVRQR